MPPHHRSISASKSSPRLQLLVSSVATISSLDLTWTNSPGCRFSTSRGVFDNSPSTNGNGTPRRFRCTELKKEISRPWNTRVALKIISRKRSGRECPDRPDDRLPDVTSRTYCRTSHQGRCDVKVLNSVAWQE